MEKIVIGKVVNAVGLKGEIKVYSYAETADRFEKLEKIFVGTENENKMYLITNVRYKGDMVILTLDGVADRNASEALKGLMVFMDEDDLEELPEGVYYIKDLIGMKVISDTGEELGILKNINTGTPQRIYEVARSGKADILIPGVDEFILDTDLQNKVITVKVIEGLYED